MMKKQKRTREDIQRVQELRRSSAASPHRNKARYARKPKHRDRAWNY